MNNYKLNSSQFQSNINCLLSFKIQQNLDIDIKDYCKGNSYNIYDEKEKIIFRVYEKSHIDYCCARWWCGPNRGFTMFVNDEINNSLFHLNRASCRCDMWCCFNSCCCNNFLGVFDNYKNLIGKVIQQYSFSSPLFHIVNENEEVLAKVVGPPCPCRCCYDMSFKIFSVYEENVQNNESLLKNENNNFHVCGTINKIWDMSTKQDTNMDHENCVITFSKQMNSNFKILNLASALLINVMYFENS